jgi:hypothetical protein
LFEEGDSNILLGQRVIDSEDEDILVAASFRGRMKRRVIELEEEEDEVSKDGSTVNDGRSEKLSNDLEYDRNPSKNQSKAGNKIESNEMDSLDFDDVAETKVYAATKKIAPSFRQQARLDAKALMAKSPYAQEMYAKAAVAVADKLEKPRVTGSKKSEDDEKKAESESDGEFTDNQRSTRSKLHIPKTAKAIASADSESDEESEYQPTQEVKKVTTRSTRNSRKKTDVPSIQMSRSTKRVAAEMALSKKQTVQSEESIVRPTRSRKKSTAKQTIAMDDESEYQPTQGEMSLGSFNIRRATRATKKTTKAEKKTMVHDEKSDDDLSFVDNKMKERDTRKTTRRKPKKTDAILNDEESVIGCRKRGGTKRGRVSSEPLEAKKTKVCHESHDTNVTAIEDASVTEDAVAKQMPDEESWGGEKGALFDEEQSNKVGGVIHNVFTQMGTSDNLQDASIKENMTDHSLLSTNYKSNAKQNTSSANDTAMSFVELNTRSITAADHASILAEIQKQTSSSQPTTPSSDSNSALRLSAVISSEKPQQTLTTNEATLRSKSLMKLTEKINNVMQELGEIVEEMNNLACLD